MKLLKPGGTLVFSTCTINPAENEANVTPHMTTLKRLSPPVPVASTAERVVGVTQVAYALSNFPLELLPQGEFHLGGCGLPGSQGLTEEQ